MRAVRLTQFRAPLENQIVADPTPGTGEILVRVEAAGICHSDAHYRSGRKGIALPLTPGHEIAGVVERVGDGVSEVAAGDRVAVHYLLSCGACEGCARGEQFCAEGKMIGKDVSGGYAEKIVIPARNAVAIPDNVSFERAAVMMCSTATAYHALRLSTVRPGESVAILGFGGLGISALQLARAMGATRIVAIDIVPEKRELARRLGAVVDAEAKDFDVVLDFAGHPETTSRALRTLAPGGRLMIVAINLTRLDFDPFADVLARERRIIGCSDHTREELVELMELASAGKIDLSQAITRTVPLDAGAVNDVFDDLERGTSHVRSVIRASSASRAADRE